MTRSTGLIAIIAAVFAATAFGGQLPRRAAMTSLDPATFTNKIDNPYWPMKAGSHWVYRETNASGARRRVDVVVTGQTKRIIGIDAVVVHDTVRERGTVVEDTYDWYAQDAKGNIWYLGEATKEYAKGMPPSTAGSWQAGIGGAKPGIVVLAQPKPGKSYREEYWAGQAEDAARVLATDQKAEVPYGFFRNALLTSNISALETKVAELKLYARGIGPVHEISISGGSDDTVLVRYTR